MTKLPFLLNVAGGFLAIAGGMLMFWTGQRSGPGLPFYQGGDVLDRIKKAHQKRSAVNQIGFGLIVLGTLLQLVATYLAS